MSIYISPSVKKKAITYLMDNIPAETWDAIAKEIRKKGPRWWASHHLGFGMGVRNLLRKGGFNAGPLLDDIWVELVEGAVKRFEEVENRKKRVIKMSGLLSRIKHFFYKTFIGNRIIKFENPIEVINGNRVWFISDMHFSHKNIIKWCRPEFQNLENMHRRLISNWNFQIGHYDRVFCLGDFGDFRLFKKLKGIITLTKGNHDKKQWNRQFILKYRDMKFLVLHDPDTQSTNWFDGDWIIHGHTHVNSPFIDIGRKRVNVSVEVINYTPISMEEIYKIVQESKNYNGNRPVR